MRRALWLLLLAGFMFLFSACAPGTKDQAPGRVVTGDSLDALFEVLPWEIMEKAKPGDVIATKYPAMFLDFRYPVAFNQYNSAFGRFAGWDRKIVTSKGEEDLKDFIRRAKQENK